MCPRGRGHEERLKLNLTTTNEKTSLLPAEAPLARGMPEGYMRTAQSEGMLPAEAPLARGMPEGRVRTAQSKRRGQRRRGRLAAGVSSGVSSERVRACGRSSIGKNVNTD